MDQDSLKQWQHEHNFSSINEKGERRTKYVLILTAVTMVAEIVAGTIFGSMALLADGWHMGTHVAAFLITIYAYRFARKHQNNPDYAFGTGKVGVLGGFTSAIALVIVALLMLVESVHRIIEPTNIQFDAAIGVAVLGLLVNVASAFILKDHHDHSHGHSHDHSHHHADHGHVHDHTHEHDNHHHDHNLHAAYMHVLADALTSMLAIVALLAGKYFGLNWLDPIMGVVGAIIITRWSYGLIKQTSPILLDASIEQTYKSAITEKIEEGSDSRIVDLHIWKVSAHHYAIIISIVSQQPKEVEEYKSLLSEFEKLSHITIEVNQHK